MDITFNKVGELWEAEFEVTADFAIHLERDKVGVFRIYQRTAGSKYALVDEVDKVYTRNVGTVDYECPSLIYPKFIKVVSGTEPTLAEIVTDGEVTEIKSQSKVVEITNNGTTEVIPDSGFAYLSKVNIKTNVPQSGEGGGEGGSGDCDLKMTYVADPDNQLPTTITGNAALIKLSLDSGTQTAVLPYGIAMALSSRISAIHAYAIPFGLKQQADGTTIQEGLYLSDEDIAALPRITEEEFYNLNV